MLYPCKSSALTITQIVYSSHGLACQLIMQPTFLHHHTQLALLTDVNAVPLAASVQVRCTTQLCIRSPGAGCGSCSQALLYMLGGDSPCLCMLQWVLHHSPNTAAGKHTSSRRIVVSGALDALAAALQVGQLRHGCSVDAQACTYPAADIDRILTLD